MQNPEYFTKKAFSLPNHFIYIPNRSELYNPTMRDQEVLKAIRTGGGAKRAAAQYLFSSHKGMMQSIKGKLKLSSNQIKDMYADALSTVIWNIDTGAFKGESKISSYLYRILYNKSVDLIRHITTNKNVAYLELSEETTVSDLKDPERVLETNLDVEQVKSAIQSMGQPCNNIIIEWAYWGYSMKEIAERNGLDNADKAKKKKYHCMKKLQTLLKTKRIT